MEIDLARPNNFKTGRIKNRVTAKSKIKLKESKINNLDNELNRRKYSATEKIINREIAVETVTIEPLNNSLR
ncbi:MAG: hypothetical protein CMP63_05290 [Flavobacteriales bacterium]|nr:hypothetical protein [Flavobacteriales bacterium]